MRTFSPKTLAEIRDSYRRAADPDEQVYVLAGLYFCNVEDIQRALGLPVRKPWEKHSSVRTVQIPTHHAWTKTQDKRLAMLYKQGLNIEEIADKIGNRRKDVQDRLYVLRKLGVIQARPRCDCAAQGMAVELENLCDALRELIAVLRVLAEKGGGAP